MENPWTQVRDHQCLTTFLQNQKKAVSKKNAKVQEDLADDKDGGDTNLNEIVNVDDTPAHVATDAIELNELPTVSTTTPSANSSDQLVVLQTPQIHIDLVNDAFNGTDAVTLTDAKLILRVGGSVLIIAKLFCTMHLTNHNVSDLWCNNM